MNREQDYTAEERERIITHVLAEVSAGRSVTRVLEDDDDMPGRRTFWSWHYRDEDLQHNLARAREVGVEVHLEEAIDIAEDGSNDWMEKRDKDGNCIGWQLNGEHVQRSKLRIETRIKRAQMIAPRKYGPKLDLTSGGKSVSTDAGDVAAKAAALLEEARRRKDERKK